MPPTTNYYCTYYIIISIMCGNCLDSDTCEQIERYRKDISIRVGQMIILRLKILNTKIRQGWCNVTSLFKFGETGRGNKKFMGKGGGKYSRVLK
jgi:hypothetical protein